jgi:hypothetical protein
MQKNYSINHLFLNIQESFFIYDLNKIIYLALNIVYKSKNKQLLFI